MRAGGKILASIMNQLEPHVKDGVSTKDLDELAFALCKKNNVKPAFLGYEGFPATLCVGVDDIAIHGIPSKTEVLRNGQTISLDMGILYEGFYSDHAKTFAVGNIDPNGKKLLATTKLALDAAIMQAIDGNHVGDIGFAMEQIVKLAGFSVIKVMVGHGLGRELHEDPQIPCYGRRGTGELLQAGMTIAIEAMVNEGTSELIFEDDGWTTHTADGKRSALFEHSVLVGKENAEILTIE